MEISLETVLRAFRKSIVLMLILSILSGIGAYFTSEYLIAPTYQSTAEINIIGDDSVMSGEGQITVTQGNNSWVYANRIAKTCSTILSANSFKQKVMEHIGLDHMPRFAVSYDEETTILIITASADNPDEAYEIAVAVVSLSNNYIDEKMSSSIGVTETEAPVRAKAPSSPNSLMNAILVFFVVAVIVLVIQVLREVLGTRVRGEVELASRYNLPVLAVIPDFTSASRKKSRYAYDYVTKGGKEK